MSKERNRNFAWTAQQQKIRNPKELAEAKEIVCVKTHNDVMFNALAIKDRTYDSKLARSALKTLLKDRRKKNELFNKEVKKWYTEADF